MTGARLDSMGSMRRTHACGALTPSLIGTEVVLAGWVHRRRDHGGVVFIDLRERGERVQVVFKPEVSKDTHAHAGQLRPEYVVLVRGIVEQRSEDTVNPELATGEVEVSALELRVLNTATPPPFPIDENCDVEEIVRLRNRVHDLRRPPLQRALRVRHRLYQELRSSLDGLGFLEIETPMLGKSTPEGARDFLVASRLQQGEFYALPQSPQILKQLLMVAGLERYFQIARCFRDEDLRADRQPEFSQLDLEMSFVGVDDILEVLEEVCCRGVRAAVDAELPRPFRRISYAEAMARYGSDRPDTRIKLELRDLTECFRKSEFRAFRAVVESGGIVKCLPIPDADELSRGEIDRLEKLVRKELGAKGLGWIRINRDGSWQSPIVKFLSEAEREVIAEKTGAGPGSVIFFQADTASRANAILSRLRVDLGERLGRREDRDWDVLFVVDFPLFERAPDGRLVYLHQPFVAPLDEDIPLLESSPEQVRGTHYDVVLNGVELGSGSLRNHSSTVQRRILELLGYPKPQAEARFGFLLNALDAGAPPHGGFAFGLDRWVMVLSGLDNLREVLAFPKTQRGQDLFMGAPSEVDSAQLEDLALRISRPDTDR